MLTLTSCPQCGAPAEITDSFTLASTDGPIPHVAVWCVSGHHFRMPAEGLTGGARSQNRTAAGQGNVPRDRVGPDGAAKRSQFRWGAPPG